MFELLSQWLEALTSFIPRIGIMKANHKGIKYKHGHNVIAINPGIYWYWPLVTEIEDLAVKRQTVKVPTQTIYAECGISISAGCVVVFEISDIIKALYETWDIDETIADEAEALLAQVISKIVSIDTDIKSLNKELTTEMRKRLASYGVSVKRANIRDFAPSKVYRIIGGTSNGLSGLRA